MKYFLLYLLLINLAAAAIVALDKWKARRKGARVPERTLFLLCALGACPGVYGAMRLCRHKTLHKRFMWGIPTIFIIQLALAAAFIYFNVYEGL